MSHPYHDRGYSLGHFRISDVVEFVIAGAEKDLSPGQGLQVPLRWAARSEQPMFGARVSGAPNISSLPHQLLIKATLTGDVQGR